MTLHAARKPVFRVNGKGVAQHGNGMDGAWHEDEGSCVVRCVRGVRGVCVCVQASPAASSTYRAGQPYTTPVMDNMLRPTEK